MRAYRFGLNAAALGLALSFVILGSQSSFSVAAATFDRANEAACAEITAVNHGYCCKLRAVAACKQGSELGLSIVGPSKMVDPFQQLTQSTGQGLNDEDDGGSVFGSGDPGDSVGRGLEGNGGGDPADGGSDMGGDMTDNGGSETPR